MNRVLTTFVAMVTYVFPSCGQTSYGEKLESLYRHTVPLIDSEVLKEKTDVVILDVRSPEEYNVSHIDGAFMIDFDKFKPKDVASLNKNSEVIVYCSVGYRSERLGEKLQKMGFKDVKNLYGGIFEWKNQGHEVVNERDVPTDSVHTYNKAWSKWLEQGIKVYE
ncbi:MAG: rhodanese-like domain-containing protein [Bacteroidota bacterium]